MNSFYFTLSLSHTESNTPLSKENVEEFLAGIDTFLLDCDGVLWRGGSSYEQYFHFFLTQIGEAIEGAAKSVALLKSRGKKVLFISNNSTRARADYVNKLGKVPDRLSGDLGLTF